MRGMGEIRAVLFDYGLVLSGPPRAEAWEAMKGLLGTDEERFHAAYWAHRHAYDRGELCGSAYWDAVAGNLGRSLTEAQRDALKEADTELWTVPNKAMIAWAGALQDAGVRTGILSNIGDAMEEGVLARCAWLQRFDHLTFSHRLLLAKPEAAIYAQAAKGLETVPEHILFVDDREDNIAAARAAGMVGVQYVSHEAFVGEMTRLGLGGLLRP